jgi:hypothetical protein
MSEAPEKCTKVAVQQAQRRTSHVRWAENIKIDHNEVGHEKGGCISLTQNKVKWRDLVKKIIKFELY